MEFTFVAQVSFYFLLTLVDSINLTPLFSFDHGKFYVRISQALKYTLCSVETGVGITAALYYCLI